MTFSQSTFGPVSSQGNSDILKIWSYRTDDHSSEVLADGYFDLKRFELNDGDYIIMKTIDGFFVMSFSFVGGAISTSDAGGSLVHQFLSYEPLSDTLIATKDLTLPSASLRFEELITISEQTGFLGLFHAIDGATFSLIDARFDDSGSFRPKNFFLKEAENNLVLQSDFSTPIAAKDFTFEITTTQLAQTNNIRLMASVDVINASVKISDKVTGIAFKYLPTRLAFDSRAGGTDLTVGNEVFELNKSPMRLAPGRALTVEVRADNAGFLGSPLGIPWLSIDLQRSEFRGLAWDHEVSWQHITSASPAEDRVIKKGSGLVVDATSGAVELSIDFSDAENDNFHCKILDHATTFNLNDVRIVIGIDTLVLDINAKNQENTLVRDGNTVRVYDGMGRFTFDGNIT